MIKNRLALFVLGAITATSIIGITHLAWNPQKMTKVHNLEYPLLLSSDEVSNGASFLPKGTTLYFDKSYPEGITRYKVYVNVDRTPLKLTDLADPTEINPIDGAIPDKFILKKLLQTHPLSKQDLALILKSPGLSKEEVKEVFEEYLRQ